MDATQHGGWGGVGHVNVPCNLHALWMLRHTGVGVGVGHVNVPCNLHALWMLRHTGVGVGVGHVDVPCNLESLADGSAMLRPGMEPVEEVCSQAGHET